MVTSFFKNIRNKLKQLAKPEKKKSTTSDAEQTAVTEPEQTATQAESGDTSQQRPPRRRRRRKKKPSPPADIRTVPAEDPAAAHADWDISQFDIPPVEGKIRFHDMELPGEILHAVADMGFHYCSPIQAAILPGALRGKDVSGQAQTGTGKTAAFLITVLAHFMRNPLSENHPKGTPRALVLAPTRELVFQIAEEARLLSKYLSTTTVTIFGGMDYQKQRRQLTDQVVDIVVATPGRLIDFCEHDDVRLDQIELLVLDEADRMADMGFMPQIRRIVRKTPHKDRRQNLFFSATMTGEVDRLAAQWTNDPLVVEIEPEQVEVASVEQIVYLITGKEKSALLYNIIMRQDLKRVIIFCNRRLETQRVADFLRRYNIRCEMISGEVPQKKRLRTLEDFRAGNVRVLVATDVAGRGLHIEGVSHVINYALPHEPENYVHRIGRTGRAGATGTSISFACEEDSFYIPAIEEFLKHELVCTQPDEEWLKLPPMPEQPKSSDAPRKPRRRPPRPRKDRSPDAHSR